MEKRGFNVQRLTDERDKGETEIIEREVRLRNQRSKGKNQKGPTEPEKKPWLPPQNPRSSR